MVDYPFSQGGASLALGYFMLPFQGNGPCIPTKGKRKRAKGLNRPRTPKAEELAPVAWIIPEAV